MLLEGYKFFLKRSYEENFIKDLKEIIKGNIKCSCEDTLLLLKTIFKLKHQRYCKEIAKILLTGNERKEEEKRWEKKGLSLKKGNYLINPLSNIFDNLIKRI